MSVEHLSSLWRQYQTSLPAQQQAIANSIAEEIVSDGSFALPEAAEVRRWVRQDPTKAKGVVEAIRAVERRIVTARFLAGMRDDSVNLCFSGGFGGSIF